MSHPLSYTLNMKNEYEITVKETVERAEEVYTDAQRASDERDDEQSNMAAEREEYEVYGSD